MEKRNTSHQHDSRVTIDSNPFNSKAMLGVLKLMNAHQITSICIDEIAQGINLNILDMPFYVAALDILSTSLKSRLDESDKEMYDQIMCESKIYTLHADKLHDHDTDDDTSASNDTSNEEDKQ